MDIKRLHYFCTIVEEGQISRAAKALHISQPPLSQRLKELEDEFGTPLILRDGRNWQVTEAGRTLYQRARQLLSMVEDIPTDVMNAAEGYQGRLIVGASSMCLSHVLRSAATFSRRHPDLRHQLVIEQSGLLEVALKKREIDVAVLLLPITEDLFDTRLLPRCGFSVLLSDKLAQSVDAESLQLEQVARLPLVLPRRSRANGTWERLLNAFQTRDLKPQILMDCPDVRTLLAFLHEDVAAAAIVPASEVPLSCRSHFRVLPLDTPDLHIQPAVVTLRNHHLTRATQAFAAHLAQIPAQAA